MNILERETKGVPPGLLRLVKGGRPYRKLFFLIFFFVFALAAGAAVIYLMENKNFQKRLAVSPLSEKANTVTHSQDTVVSSKTEDKDKMIPSARSTVPSNIFSHGVNRPENNYLQQTTHRKETGVGIKKVKKESLRKIPLRNAQLREARREKFSETAFNKPAGLNGADFLFRAHDLEAKGNLEEATLEYVEYVNATGRKDPLIINKIITLYLLSGNPHKASHWVDLAVKEWPNNPMVLANCAVVKARLGNLTEAERLLQRAVTVDPENRNALFNLAVLKERKGEKKEALLLYERLSKMGDTQAREHVKRLQQE